MLAEVPMNCVDACAAMAFCAWAGKELFGAPAALFCSIDRTMGPPQWSDLGMFLQNVMLLLTEAGVDSCPQECWSTYPLSLIHI